MCTNAVVHLIDDDQTVLESLRFLLEAESYEVRAYDCAETFLSTMGLDCCGCIITDIQMPGISGIDLLGFLRARRIATPVIVMSGGVDRQLAAEAMKLGAGEFFAKPLDHDALLAAISQNISCAAVG